MSKPELIGAVIVTHGELGNELLVVAERISGEKLQHMAAVSVGWHDEVEEAKGRIEEAVKSVDGGRGVIVLTDMFGGTPSNVSLSLLKEGIEIVTGVNLPMVVKLASQSGKESLAELTQKVEDQGKRQISVASELLGG